ncbi:MAG: peptide deformylase [Lachnospiraceae bacterium]|nr:peptide deformylase [Lachnospiraceae bacterium]
MVKPIVKDMLLLGQKSEPATKDDLYIAKDLRDTLDAHKDRCVGMAANMIGYKKCIIIVSTGFLDLILINPQIVGSKGKYETEEGCLSLDGVRKTSRFQEIEVKYLDEDFKEHKQKFSGFIAQNIQHQCDHLNGKII